MALSFVTALFGCTGRGAEPWQTLTYHVTSSVQTEGCHFVLIRDGGMMLSGCCFDGNTEHRTEAATPISQATVDSIEAMELDKASTARRKLFGVADGTQVIVTLDYADGSQRKISLSAQQRMLLRELLQKELVGK